MPSGNRRPGQDGHVQGGQVANSSLPIDQGFPAYYPDAKSFVVLIDPSRQEFMPGEDKTGDGTALNVRALYQRCPHLGCKPNPCLKNFWFECPCHGSRYDRLGHEGPRSRLARRRAAWTGSRCTSTATAPTVDTSKITLGPLPVALGQPGLIPPKPPTGCI